MPMLAGLLAVLAAVTPIPVILDTDLGDDIDDTWALAQVLGSPALDLRLIVTASDNTPEKTRLVAKMLEAWGRTDIPLATGKQTSDNPTNQRAWLGDYDLAGYAGTVHADGVQALIDTVLGGVETICVIGPQTNLAEALKRNPEVGTRARIFAMAGSVHVGYGGKAEPDPEWNVFRDVEAARAVFAAPWPITMAPLDTCGTLTLSGEQHARVRASGHPLARVVLENYALWTNRKHYAQDATSVLFDTLAVQLIHDESQVEMEEVRLRIDDRGATVPDPAGRPVRCALTWKDMAGFEAALIAAVTTGGGREFAPPVAYRQFPGPDALPVVEGVLDPFVKLDGTRVADAAAWPARRAEILALNRYYQYGTEPPAPGNVTAEKVGEETLWDGEAVLERHVLTFGPEHRLSMEIGVYRPADSTAPRGVAMSIDPVWDEAFREVAREAVGRGYLFAGYNQLQLDGDNDDRSDGAHPVYPEYDWATLSVWAWGASRLIDYLETRPDVDPKRLALTGHSRRGKTAQWAAALDERIAFVMPHASGEGGSGSHRIQGEKAESLDAITDPKRFHYWFSPRLREFVGKEDRLPFDQHFVKALIAPRALVAQEALDDHWANPMGTQQMWRAAQPVFEFLGAPGHNRIYFREGGHSMTPCDWTAYFDYCDHFFAGGPLPENDGRLAFPDLGAAHGYGAPGG